VGFLDFSFDIEYLGGIWQKANSKSGHASIGDRGFDIRVGGMSMGDKYFIPWTEVLAINLTGSSKPAFQSVPRYLTGIPGLQTMSSQSVPTGAKCFIAVAYTWIERKNFPKETSTEPNTLRMYALNRNQADIETQLAQYMHIVDQNAQQFAGSQTQQLPNAKGKGRRGTPKMSVAAEVMDDDFDDDDGDSSDHVSSNRKASSTAISKSLKELATMYNEGLLTKKEFEQAKKKLLQ
jgi:hypothetical protein